MKKTVYGFWDKNNIIRFDEEFKTDLKETAIKKDGELIKISLEDTDYKTRQQEKYYWGVIIETLKNDLGYEKKELHAYFKYLMACNDFSGVTAKINIPYLDISTFLRNLEHPAIRKLINLYSTKNYSKEQYILLITMALDFARQADIIIQEAP